MSKHIGRFELRGELGRGAQSIVYLGFDPQLQREIAIKTLHFAHPDPIQNRALLDEARTVGKMRHPSIVPIFEAGEQDGDLYLVFEYVPGKNLAEFLRQSDALPPIKAVSIFSMPLRTPMHRASSIAILSLRIYCSTMTEPRVSWILVLRPGLKVPAKRPIASPGRLPTWRRNIFCGVKSVSVPMFSRPD